MPNRRRIGSSCGLGQLTACSVRARARSEVEHDVESAPSAPGSISPAGSRRTITLSRALALRMPLSTPSVAFWRSPAMYIWVVSRPAPGACTLKWMCGVRPGIGDGADGAEAVAAVRGASMRP